MVDTGFTHVALPVSDLAASVAFYERWADMTLLEQVEEKGAATAARLGDATRPFVLVLIQGARDVTYALDGFGHLGIECPSRADVDRRSAAAREAGCLRHGPVDSGPPRGYWSVLADPDGHQLELSHGQHNVTS
jgi:catechol 2,3-dioxygenase-like lactoylglutathione lyase family enzyme